MNCRDTCMYPANPPQPLRFLSTFTIVLGPCLLSITASQRTPRHGHRFKARRALRRHMV